MSQPPTPLIKHLGLRLYTPIWEAMRRFTAGRGPTTTDQFWVLEHPPVYTFGLAGRHEHLLNTGNIPVLPTDRGGQVTYHGPGQLVVYTLLDLQRLRIGVKTLVTRLEQAVIDLLAQHYIKGERKDRAPGVYVSGAKIAALGLRVRHGCAYHGLALNVAMDLEPFTRINPCGFKGLAVTQTQDLGVDVSVAELCHHLLPCLMHQLGYPCGGSSGNTPTLTPVGTMTYTT